MVSVALGESRIGEMDRELQKGVKLVPWQSSRVRKPMQGNLEQEMKTARVIQRDRISDRSCQMGSDQHSMIPMESLDNALFSRQGPGHRRLGDTLTQHGPSQALGLRAPSSACYRALETTLTSFSYCRKTKQGTASPQTWSACAHRSSAHPGVGRGW